ncbi:MAG: flagellar basal body rod C-terminal domain-containing protein, partial [Hyphomonadaceae bacterium]
EADERIADKVSLAQDLINRIGEFNKEIRLTLRSGADATAVENAQSAAIDELSSLLDIRVSPLAEGGVHVRTSGGALLVGETTATLDYTPSGASFGSYSTITYNAALDNAGNLEPFLLNGEIKGLLQTRDVDLKQLAEALGGFAAEIGDALNAVHNENTSYPAVTELTGRQTGLISTDALNFSGSTLIGVTDSEGVLSQRLTIDFDAGQIVTEQPAGSFAFSNTIGSFAAALDLALGASGDASFSAGQLSISAANGGGLVIQQDSADPSDRAGRGFSHFFGLNDLVGRPAPMFFETGGSASDLHGLAAGGALTFTVKDAAGRVIGDPSVAISGALAGAGSTWSDLVTALNNPTTGLGQYATFAYDSTTGQIGWTAKTGFQLALTGDTTQRGATGVSMSSLFGLGPAAGAARAVEVDVVASIGDDPTRLAVGRPDLSADIGVKIIEAGDNRGATALARARDEARSFHAAGSLSAQTTTLATYSARFAGLVGRISSDAQRAADGASALATAASDRRSQVEGVSIDDELIRMTTYQNAYAAASRLIQAANEMYEILLQLGRY